ncbi:MAG: cupin domain-containing protein [Flavobacteriales bacterium]
METTPNEAQELILSGKLEAFVLGTLPADERFAVLRASNAFVEVREEITRLEEALERSAQSPASGAPIFLKANILDRLKGDSWHQDTPGDPPILHAGSSRSDYADWLDLPEIAAPPVFEDPFYIPIGQTAQAITLVVWLRNGAPAETHTDCVEKFLVLEGSCEIHLPDAVHKLQPGDKYSIPLHIPHTVVVTSSVPCKLVVQRVAA